MISPVIATSLRTGIPVSIDVSATNIVMPALGPSLGMAPPERECADLLCRGSVRRCQSCLARLRTYDVAVCADSFITSPSCPVSVRLLFARHPCRFNKQDVSADGRPRKSGGHAGNAGAFRDFGQIFLRPQIIGNLVGDDGGLFFRFAFGHFHRDATTDTAKLSLQGPDTPLRACSVDDFADGSVLECDVVAV